jgi:hypothetical protein
MAKIEMLGKEIEVHGKKLNCLAKKIEVHGLKKCLAKD